MHSINARLLIVGSVVLSCFVLFTGLTLDRAFQLSAQAATKERLRVHVFGLIGGADVDGLGRINLPAALPESRFNQPQSGLYAQVSTNNSDKRWQSSSLLGLDLPFFLNLPKGDIRFERRRATLPTGIDREFFVFGFGVNWEIKPGKNANFTFSVAESLTDYYAQLKNYQRSLWGWLAALALVLVAVQIVILRWGLTPLRQVTQDLLQIEKGRQTQLSGRYPAELQGLTDNINRLIQNERSNLKRYRDTLGDLAHSLKTPLSVLRTVLENAADTQELKQTVAEQTERMTTIVTYQLQRAVASGHVTFAAPLDVTALAQRVLQSLAKVYAAKGVLVEMHAQDTVPFQGEEGDLMEVLGNLFDNAHKWCRNRLQVHIRIVEPEKDNKRCVLEIAVHDDGPGIAENLIQEVLKRGVRADSRVEGHGIGLSIVQDIVQAYDGQLRVERSPTLKGAAITVTLPSR